MLKDERFKTSGLQFDKRIFGTFEKRTLGIELVLSSFLDFSSVNVHMPSQGGRETSALRTSNLRSNVPIQ